MNTPADDSSPVVPGGSFGVGPTLRAAREQRGQTLAEVASQLRIRQPFLHALEEGRHKDLPGGTYAVGFLRTYAEFLGLDGEEMIRRFRDEAEGLHTRSELLFPSPVTEGRIPGGAILFLGLLLAGVAYGGWYFLSSRDSKVAEMVPPLPDRLNTVLNRQASLTGDGGGKPADGAAAPEQQPAAPVASMPASDSTVTLPVKGGEVTPPSDGEVEKKDSVAAVVPPTPVVPAPPVAPAPEVKREPAKPAEPAKPVEAPKAEPPKPTEAAQAEVKPMAANDAGDSRIQLKASADDCWVQIRELDGQLLMSRLLHRGEGYSVPNRPGLTLMVGNAGALEITVDGKKAPSLGAGGQVRRDIKLDPDKLLTGG